MVLVRSAAASGLLSDLAASGPPLLIGCLLLLMTRGHRPSVSRLVVVIYLCLDSPSGVIV